MLPTNVEPRTTKPHTFLSKCKKTYMGNVIIIVNSIEIERTATEKSKQTRTNIQNIQIVDGKKYKGTTTEMSDIYYKYTNLNLYTMSISQLYTMCILQLSIPYRQKIKSTQLVDVLFGQQNQVKTSVGRFAFLHCTKSGCVDFAISYIMVLGQGFFLSTFSIYKLQIYFIYIIDILYID